MSYVESQLKVRIVDQEHQINKGQGKGRVGQVEGHVKKAAGKVVGNNGLEENGKFKKNVGKVQSGLAILRRT